MAKSRQNIVVIIKRQSMAGMMMYNQTQGSSRYFSKLLHARSFTFEGFHDARGMAFIGRTERMHRQYVFTPVLLLQFLTALFLLALCAYSWRRRSVPGALPFAVGSLLAAFWVTASFMEYAAIDISTKIFWVKVQAALQLPATTAITCFALEYARPDRWLTRRNLILLSIVPLLFLLLLLTNDLHHLLWRGFAFDGAVIPLRSPSIWIVILYATLLGVAELIVFGWLFWRSPPHRWPVAIMVSAQIVARVVYLLSTIAYIHSDLPLDVIVIAYLFLSYAIALFAFSLLDPIPLASQTVIEQLQDGILVLDSLGQAAMLNAAARVIFGIPAQRNPGQPVRELLPARSFERTGPVEVSLNVGSLSRTYMLEDSPLMDWRGLEVGRLLTLHDVTDQKRSQDQIIEQQRALAVLHERERLARELHDSTGQVLSYVSLQAQAIRKYLHDGNLAVAESQLARLADAASAAHVDVRESILSLKAGSRTSLSFLAALKEYLDAYSNNYGIQAELLPSDELSETDFASDISVQLLRVIGEAMTNARKHSGAACVQVSLMRENQHILIVIADDGKGFDADRLTTGQSHFGLAFMCERMAQVGGKLEIDSELGKGTRVLLRVPVWENCERPYENFTG